MHIGGIGTIEKRGPNTWRIRLAVGRDFETGKYRQHSRTVHGSKADAFRAREEMRRELEGGGHPHANKVTFSQFAIEFEQRREMNGGIKAITLSADRMLIRRLYRYLGETPLHAIDVSMLVKTQMRMREDGYTQAMLHCTLGKLNQILKEAVRADLIPTNPCDKIDLPRSAPHALCVLDAQGARRLLEALDVLEHATHDNSQPDQPNPLLVCSRIMACRLALSTGMRRGEILGLTWDNVDLDKAKLRVIQQYTAESVVRAPKTKSGIRTISLDEAITQGLRVWRARQEKLLAQAHIAVTPALPVVSNSIGAFAHPSDFNKWWATFRNENNFPGLRFHDLRHTQATLLIGNGVDIKTVQNRLGHSRAATTLDTYATALPENDRKAADLFGMLLQKTP
ncbi:MAG: tyrosine-type recombinase/integrase [Raoultibacter sp.]